MKSAVTSPARQRLARALSLSLTLSLEKGSSRVAVEVRPALLARQHGAAGPARRDAQALCVKGVEVEARGVGGARGGGGCDELLDGGLLEAGDAHGRGAVQAALGYTVEVRRGEDERRADEELPIASVDCVRVRAGHSQVPSLE